MTDTTMNRADAIALWAQVNSGLELCGALRQRARELGLQMPEDIRQLIYKQRRTLLDAGLPLERVDAIPALELPL